MSNPQWTVENVPSPTPAIPPDQTYDLLAEAIDEQAASFDEPAKFRSAVYKLLAEAETLNIDDIAQDLAWKRLEKIFAALEHFKDPQITVDALRCLAHMNDERGIFISDLAQRHGISRQSMHKRIIRVGRFLDIEYRRTKPHPSQRSNVSLYGCGAFVVHDKSARIKLQ